MNDFNNATLLSSAERAVVPREQTQAILDLRAAASARIKPADRYTLADRLEEQAQRHGERPFIIYGEQRLSFALINARADRLAHVLYARGLRPGDVCALAMENRPEFFCCWFALAKLGVVAGFVNTQVSGRPLVHALQAIDAKAMLVGEEVLGNVLATEGLPPLPLWLVADAEQPWTGAMPSQVDTGLAQALATAPAMPFPRDVRADLRAESPCLLIFTSGTTGLPKAARYSHMRWMSTGDIMEITLQTTAHDVFYCCLPLYHGAAATSVTSTALKTGAAIVVRRKFSVREFWNDVRKHHVSVFQYIGEICRYLLNQPEVAGERDHGLRCMLGAGLTRESWQNWLRRFGPIQVFEGWGSTESNTNVVNVDNYLGACGRVPYWKRATCAWCAMTLKPTATHGTKMASTSCARRARWVRPWVLSSTIPTSAAGVSRVIPQPRRLPARFVAMCSARAMPTGVQVTCCVLTRTATCILSTALATLSAGKVKTFPPLRWRLRWATSKALS